MTSTALDTTTEARARLDDASLRDISEGLATAHVTSLLPSGSHRRWSLIARTDVYEAWVIAWPVGTGLGMHDHDGSSAALTIVAGPLRERFVHPDGTVELRWLHAGAATSLPADHVHEVVNVGDHEAVSVHVYSPPLGNMAFRDDPEIALDSRGDWTTRRPRAAGSGELRDVRPDHGLEGGRGLVPLLDEVEPIGGR